MHAWIQCLHSEWAAAFILGDEVLVPISIITMLVQPPLLICHLSWFHPHLPYPEVCLYYYVKYMELVQSFTSYQEYDTYVLPHRLKANRTVVMLPLILYTDDTSGNKSKQRNKFDSWCLKLAGLPNVDNMNLQSIHHLCSSNKVILLVLMSHTYI